MWLGADRARPGLHRLESANSAPEGFTIDRVVLSNGEWSRTAAQEVPVTLTADERTHRRADVGPCPTGCWVVLGEGLNKGWKATVDGASLGPATFVDGGMSGWWLPPSDTTRAIEFNWTPQRLTDIGLALTVLVAVAALMLLIVGRHHDARARPSQRATAPRFSANPRGSSDARCRTVLCVSSVVLTVHGDVTALPRCSRSSQSCSRYGRAASSTSARCPSPCSH